jgi:valyl-tRNA synthetase
MTDRAEAVRTGLPDRPTLDGLEDKWASRWQEEGTYAFDRAYGLDSGAFSAKAALARALSMQLRLSAPVLPYVTEEAWSWWRHGSVHRAPWPTVAELDLAATDGDRAALRLAGTVLAQVRRAKSERRLSMRVEVPLAEVRGTATELDLLGLVAADLRSAGRIGKLDLFPSGTSELMVACTFPSQIGCRTALPRCGA